MRPVPSQHRIAVTVFVFFVLVSAALLPASAVMAVPSLPPPTFELMWGGSLFPANVHADNFGNVYAINGFSPTIVRYDTEGNLRGGMVSNWPASAHI